MKKTVLFLAIAIIMTLSLATTALAAEPEVNWFWTIKEKGEFSEGGSFSEGLALFIGSNDKYGFIDTAGRVVVSPQYDWGTRSFSEGLALICKDGKYGYIDKNGNEVIPLIYDYADDFSEGLAPVKKDGKLSYINKSGEVVLSLPDDRNYFLANPFYDGIAVVKINIFDGGYIDRQGNEILPPIYYQYVGSRFYEGLSVVSNDDVLGYIDKTGRMVLSLDKTGYAGAGNFHEGLAYYHQNEKYGYIDKAGKVVIPLEYDEAHDFCEGLARVKKDDKWGYIDKTGNWIVQPEYDNFCKDFNNGLAVVNKGFLYGYINREGKLVTPIKYSSASTLSEGLGVVVTENLKWGYIDATGREIISPTYVKVSGFSEGYAFVWAKDKYGIIKNPLKEIPGSSAEPSLAQASTQTVTVDGKAVEFSMYALGGGSTNYIRVRDLATILNGTAAQFQVGWNGNVALTTNTSYDGITDKAPYVGDMPYANYSKLTYVDGKPVNLEAIQITYDGGGYTYYKLRDLGQALGFNVGWKSGVGIFVETDKPYDPNN